MSFRMRFTLITTLFVLGLVVFVRPANTDEPPVSATIETSLATEGDQIRQLAFDGDDSTVFISAGKVSQNDHFTLVFDKPVTLRSVTVATGRPDGSDVLETGAVQVSPDGKTFERLASFVK